MKSIRTCHFLLLGLSASSIHAAEDLIIEDFEKKRGDWTFEGDAFAGYGGGNYWHPGRFDRGLLRTRGHRGYVLLKSWGHDGREVDGRTGRALSHPFKLERNFIRFVISGGRTPGRVCVNLLIENKVVRSATGNNSNLLQAVAFDVAQFRDKEAQIQVVDLETGPWGHVCIDDLIQSDNSSGARIANDLKIQKTDRIWSRSGRQEGEVHWLNGQLHFNERPVQWEAIKSISLKASDDRTLPPHATHFHNGEIWRVEILTLANGNLTLKGALFGERTVDLSTVTSLEFSPGVERAGTTRPGMLYRTTGRPIPGQLKWIKHGDIAVDCALGIVPLPRTGLIRYVLPQTELVLGKVSRDEIGLVDGSILRGEIRLENEKLVLAHPILETLDIPWEKLRYLIRASKETQWLTDVVDRKVESSGPLGAHTGVEYLDLRHDNKSSLSVVRVVPKTMVRYKLQSAGQNNNRIFRAALSPIPGSLGDATVTLSVGTREFYRKEISAKDNSHNLSLPIPEGQELVLEVEFGKRLAYPSGIDLHDAHLAGATSTQQGGRP